MGSSSSQSALPSAWHRGKPSTNPSPTPIPFTYQNIDDPNSSFNEVTGINQLEKLTGVYGAGSASNIYVGYTLQPPYTQFRPVQYPGAQGTFASSLSSNKIVAGFVINPSNGPGIWGFVRFNSLWTLMTDPKQGTGNNAVTEILGINDSQYGVGFYVNKNGNKVPFEVNVPQNSFTDLAPPNAINAEATGINGKGNIAGWEEDSKGNVRAFYLQAGTYYPVSFPGAAATYALSLNWQDQLVGDYVDSQGATHGFILTGPTRGGKSQIWQTIDEPNAAAGTWVTCMSNHEYIGGYYIDANGVQHGFLGTP